MNPGLLYSSACQVHKTTCDNHSLGSPASQDADPSSLITAQLHEYAAFNCESGMQVQNTITFSESFRRESVFSLPPWVPLLSFARAHYSIEMTAPHRLEVVLHNFNLLGFQVAALLSGASPSPSQTRWLSTWEVTSWFL